MLGDILFTRGDYQLALRAYYRALDLMSNSASYDKEVLFARARKIREIWEEEQTSEYILEDFHKGPVGFEQIFIEFNTAKTWLSKFQEIEMQFIQQGKATPFKVISEEMENTNIHLPTVLEAGFYKGSTKKPFYGYRDPFSIIASIAILLTLLAVITVSLWVTFRYIARRIA